MHVPDGDRIGVHVLVRVQPATADRAPAAPPLANHISDGGHQREVSGAGRDGRG